MSGYRRLLAVVLLAGASTQCLLVTESVNMPPDVQLVAPETMVKGKEAMFSARGSDPDQESATLEFQWFVRALAPGASEGECPRSPAQAAAATDVPVRPLDRDPRMKFTPPGRGTFCVWVVVRDRQGATGIAGQAVPVNNQTPVAQLALVSPKVAMNTTMTELVVPLYSEVRVSGATSHDPDDDLDKLSFRWKVEPPPGSPDPAACREASAAAASAEVCRRLSVPGKYRFELRLSDADSESPPAMVNITAAPDALPCLERTEPPHDLPAATNELPLIVASPLEPLTFRVLEVSDDGDPFPGASGAVTGSFTWHYRLVGARDFERISSTTLTALTFLGDRFRLGDEVEVRLQIRDRQEGADSNRCGDAPRCHSPAAPGCFQRVSWKVRFSL